MAKSYAKLNDYNAISDRSGKKFKASEMRLQWDGLYVHKSELEPRHPQDFLKGRPDNQNVPWTRPDSNADTNIVTVDGKLLFTPNAITPVSIPNQAIPDVAIPSWSKGYTNPL